MSKSLRLIIDDVADRPRDDCWNWESKVDKDGYGRIFAGGFVTHIVLGLTNRPKPMVVRDAVLVKQQARHSCDNKRCYNPDHLLWGTAQNNANDRVERSRMPKGEKHPHSKLTEQEVKEIRSRYEAGVHNPNNITNLGKEFNVTPRTISLIVNRKTWVHL